MPLKLFGNSSGKSSKKKGSYSPRNSLDDSPTVVYRTRSATLGSGTKGRRHSSPPAEPPPGILKKSGRIKTNTSYPALQEGMIPQEMAAAVPMPNETELNKMFIQLVDELGLSRELMFKLPLNKKWELYLSKVKEQQSTKGADPQPEYYIDQIVQLTAMLHNATEEAADSDNNLRVINELKTALRTQPISFVLRFVDQNGLEQFLNFLQGMNTEVRRSQLHYVVIGCIKALMNNPEGRGHVLAHPRGIVVIAQSIRSINIKTKILALEILGALCLVPGGHRKVLGAIDHFQRFAMERTRFQTLVIDLTKSLDDRQDAANLQIAILSFINVIINYKAGEESLEFRMHLRHEFLNLGILPIINRLKAFNIAQLNKHLEIFELVRLEDERELSFRLDAVNVDINSLSSMINLLQRKTAHTLAYSHLLSIVYHCLLLPLDDPLYAKYWHLIDRLVQQVVLQQQQGVDPDHAPIPIDVDNLVQKLAKEDELHALRQEAGEMRKERDDYRFKLRKKEWECESRVMERDQYRTHVDKLKQKLNRKGTELNEAWARDQEFIDKNAQLQAKVEMLQEHIQRLETALKDGNITNLPVLPTLEATPPIQAPPPPPPPSLPIPPPPPAPPAPPAAPVPPPPAPPTLQGHAPIIPEGVQLRRKNVPKPSQALKSLNWKKLPANKITSNTVWKSIDDSKIHAVLDLSDFEQTFSVYQRREASPTTLQRRSRTSMLITDRPKELSVIEGRRAQNCTIMLSKIKMSDIEIREAIMTMDCNDRLNKDMVELMVKYVPSSEEVALLQSHTHEKDTMARADRFLLEMSSIPRYGQRLKSLYFMKTRDDRLSDLRPGVQDILYGSKELLESTKLTKILEIVLAFGNYMNRGNMGNAAGFRLASLNKIIDTKSSSTEGMTLLHYLVKTLEQKFPDVLLLDSELRHIKNASKVDLKEVEKEFADLKYELREVEKELSHQRSKATPTNEVDLFVPTMEGFVEATKAEFDGLAALIADMKRQYDETLQYFGEDPTDPGCPSTDEFFGIFSTFLVSFSDAHTELLLAQKRKEDEAKRKEELERAREMTLKRRRNRLKMEGNNTPTKRASSSEYAENELDDLIAVLKTGEYFSHRKGRSASTSTLRKLEVSRERPTSMTEDTFTEEPN